MINITRGRHSHPETCAKSIFYNLLYYINFSDTRKQIFFFFYAKSMFKFNVSAPGRVFLYGSPMSYKKLSMGASINLRTRLTFSSILPGPPHFVEINFSNIMLHMKIPLQIVSAYFDTKNFDPSILTDAELHSAVKNHISSLNDYTGEYNPNNRAHQLSLEAFLFLLLRMARKESISIKSSFMVKVSTELTIGEGLGSSSSFVTCLAACFYRWSLLQKGTVIYFFEDEHLLHISKYVQSCDFIVYNSSTSKLDSSISVFGSVQLFEKEAMANLHCNIPNMKILLVFSNVSQKTMTEQGEHMERMLQSYPFVESIQKSIDEVVEKSTEIFEDLETSLSRLNDVYNITCDSDEDLYELFPKSSCEQLSVSFPQTSILLHNVLVLSLSRT